MKRTALLMCRNQSSLRLLAEVLEKVEVEPELCLSSDDAIETLLQGHFSALVLDFDLSGALYVARLARMSSPHRRPVIFAMIGARTHVSDIYQAGANLVLYKPLAAEQVMHSLRAGLAFIRADRRQSAREKLEALVYLQFGIAQLPGLILNLGQQGLSLQAPEPLPAVHCVPLRFVLPGTSHMIEGTGEVIWADDEGRAGIFFSHLTADSRKHLGNWLRKREADRADRQGSTRSDRTRYSSLTAH